MPSIDINFLNSLKQDYKNYNNFIETGTFYGETIMQMKRYFSNLYTIEIKEEFYKLCVKRYKGSGINFLLGDSSEVLKNLLPNINGNSIIFLDGHWSAGNTGRGKKDCPLYEELESIMKFHKGKCLIIVDDVRLFGMGPNVGNEVCNWEDINVSNILKIAEGRLKDNYFLPSNLHEKDRLILELE